MQRYWNTFVYVSKSSPKRVYKAYCYCKKLNVTIWRCMYRASYCNVYINQRDIQILGNNLYFFVKWLYMFRTIISPSSGATFNKLYNAIGICRYVWLLYTVKIIHKNLWISLVYIHTNVTDLPFTAYEPILRADEMDQRRCTVRNNWNVAG